MNLYTEIMTQLDTAESLLNTNRAKAAKVRVNFVRRALKKYLKNLPVVEVPGEELSRLWVENKNVKNDED